MYFCRLYLSLVCDITWSLLNRVSQSRMFFMGYRPITVERQHLVFQRWLVNWKPVSVPIVDLLLTTNYPRKQLGRLGWP